MVIFVNPLSFASSRSRVNEPAVAAPKHPPTTDGTMPKVDL